jgi:hypothetical protein
MSFENTTDARLIAFCHSIRDQIADRAIGSKHRLIGEGVKQYTQSLEAELHRRGLGPVLN